MLLGMIPMICFGILRIFREKNRKRANWKSGHIWLLRRSVGNPRCEVDLSRGVGYPCRGEAEVPKWHPSGTPQRSYCSHR